MASDDIKHRASKLEKLMLASNQSQHIRGKSEPLPSAVIKEKAEKLQRMLGGNGAVNKVTSPQVKLGAAPFTAVSPAVWAEIWAQSENCVTTIALEGFAEWTGMWVLEPVAFIGGSVSAATGCVTGAPPMLRSRLLSAGELAPTRPAAVAFCEDALDVIDKWFLQVRSMLTVPTQAWYPTFIAYSGPVAPPTPNMPGPFSAMAQLAMSLLNAQLLSAQLYQGALKRDDVRQWNKHFGDNQKDIARPVCDLIAARVIHGLQSVFQQSIVANVMAMGTVAGFAPPIRSMGPVSAQTLPAVGFVQGADAAVRVSLLTTRYSMEGVTL